MTWKHEVHDIVEGEEKRDEITWWYSQGGPEGLRKYALEKASNIGGYENSVDRVIDDALKIEAYLKGELEDPDAHM